MFNFEKVASMAQKSRDKDHKINAQKRTITELEAKLAKATELLESMLETIYWFGGDAFEMSAMERATQAVYYFLEKENPATQEKRLTLEEYMDANPYTVVYCLRSNRNRYTKAQTKRHAKNIFGVSLKEVVCVGSKQSGLLTTKSAEEAS